MLLSQIGKTDWMKITKVILIQLPASTEKVVYECCCHHVYHDANAWFAKYIIMMMKALTGTIRVNNY